MATAPIVDDALPDFREAKLMPVDLAVERRDDGTILLRSRVAIAEYDANIPPIWRAPPHAGRTSRRWRGARPGARAGRR